MYVGAVKKRYHFCFLSHMYVKEIINVGAVKKGIILWLKKKGD